MIKIETVKEYDTKVAASMEMFTCLSPIRVYFV